MTNFDDPKVKDVDYSNSLGSLAGIPNDVQDEVDRRRHHLAANIKDTHFKEVQANAAKSSADVKSARIRKEVSDAIDESCRHQKAHELDLKNELAAAKHKDALQGIKEKQARLQGRK